MITGFAVFPKHVEDYDITKPVPVLQLSVEELVQICWVLTGDTNMDSVPSDDFETIGFRIREFLRRTGAVQV